MAADEGVRGRFRRRSVGRTLFLGLACANLSVTEEDARSPRAPAELAALKQRPTLSLGSLRILDLYSQRSLRQGLGAYLGNLWKAAPANNPQEARHALN
ncbi:hypothetical protein ACP3TH_05785 [Desulforudis sp. 1031]|uniref:hypothetical protein n=1 Tax=Desulforudis sp. Tu-874 TaxID=3416276 RepID=UPI003CE48CF1